MFLSMFLLLILRLEKCVPHKIIETDKIGSIKKKSEWLIW